MEGHSLDQEERPVFIHGTCEMFKTAFRIVILLLTTYFDEAYE